VSTPPEPLHGAPATTLSRQSLLVETLLVLGVSLGASAVWSVLSLVRKMTAEQPLSAQTTAMNNTVTPDQPWLDLAYQVTGIAVALVPVALAQADVLEGKDGLILLNDRPVNAETPPHLLDDHSGG